LNKLTRFTLHIKTKPHTEPEISSNKGGRP